MVGFNKLVRVDIAAGHGAGWVDLPVSTLVPKNKTLVLQFVSTSAEMPSGQKPNPVIVVLDAKGSAVVQHYPVSHFQLVYAGSDIHKAAHFLHIVLKRDLTLRLDTTRDSTTGDARCFFGLSGTIV